MFISILSLALVGWEIPEGTLIQPSGGSLIVGASRIQVYFTQVLSESEKNRKDIIRILRDPANNFAKLYSAVWEGHRLMKNAPEYLHEILRLYTGKRVWNHWDPYWSGNVFSVSGADSTYGAEDPFSMRSGRVEVWGRQDAVQTKEIEDLWDAMGRILVQMKPHDQETATLLDKRMWGGDAVEKIRAVMLEQNHMLVFPNHQRGLMQALDDALSFYFYGSYGYGETAFEDFLREKKQSWKRAEELLKTLAIYKKFEFSGFEAENLRRLVSGHSYELTPLFVTNAPTFLQALFAEIDYEHFSTPDLRVLLQACAKRGLK